MFPPPRTWRLYPLEVKDVHDGSPQPKGSYALEVKDVHDGPQVVPLGSPGAGPAPVPLPEAFGSLTEGYSAAAPAADPLPVLPRSTSARLMILQFTVDSARGVQKHRVLRCFGPFDGQGFYLGDVQKPWFLRGFWLQGEEQIGKVGILKVFQLST